MQDIRKKAFVYLLICGIGMASFVLADNAVHPAQPRQCYSCEGINCQRTSRQNTTTTCTDLLDICITIFEDFAVVAKGCYLDMPENYRSKCNSNNNPECSKCFGQLCNNKGREDFKCIECNDNSKCDKDTSDMAPVQCAIPTASNSFCYVRKVDGSKTQRGCLVHLQEQLNCLNDASCSMCLSNDGVACNSYKIDTSSMVSEASSIFAFSASLCLALCLVTLGLQQR